MKASAIGNSDFVNNGTAGNAEKIVGIMFGDSGSHDDAGALWLNIKIVFEQGAQQQVMRVANSKLGIGATNPLKALHIDTNVEHDGIWCSRYYNNNPGIAFSTGEATATGETAMKLVYNHDNNAMIFQSAIVMVIMVEVILWQLSAMVMWGLDQCTTEKDVAGTVKATAFIGDGSGLTGVTASGGVGATFKIKA